MSILDTLVTVVALVALFLFAIKKLSHQIERVAGDSFKQKVRSLTSTPFKGTVVGTVITTLLQSSTATTVMAVGLVNAGVLSFYNSLGIIFGANLGSAITTQIFALNLSAIAPYIVIIGFITMFFETPLKKYSKMIFYFGVMFLCLSFINLIVAPLEHNDKVAEFFTLLTDGHTALIVGLLFSLFFHSSSVTSGIAIILASKGLIGLTEATYIIFGANIGTTSTALLASAYADRTARKTGMAHLLFNILGVIIMIPVLTPFLEGIKYLGGSVSQQIVNAHIIFNLISAALALIFVHQFADLVDKCVPKKPEVMDKELAKKAEVVIKI